MSRSRLVILYDDRCAFCQAQIRFLRRLDWLGLLEPRPASDPGEEAAALGVTSQALAGAIHCITPDGRVLRAARALRVIGSRVPLLFPLAMLLWVPGILWLAEFAYRWVSRNRYRFGPTPRGGNSCRRDPPKPAVIPPNTGSQSGNPSPANRGAEWTSPRGSRD